MKGQVVVAGGTAAHPAVQAERVAAYREELASRARYLQSHAPFPDSDETDRARLAAARLLAAEVGIVLAERLEPAFELVRPGHWRWAVAS